MYCYHGLSGHIYYKESNPPQVITQKQSHINSVSILLKRSVLLVKNFISYGYYLYCNYKFPKLAKRLKMWVQLSDIKH